MPQQQPRSFLSLLILPPKKPKASKKTTPRSTKDTVPAAIWLQAGGTGPPPSWLNFLSLARRRAERTRVDREAAAAWDREKEAAFKAVEEVWGHRGMAALGGRRPGRKELMAWYAGYRAHKGEGSKAGEEEKNEGGEGEGVVMSGGNGDGDDGGNGGGEGEDNADGDGDRGGEGQGKNAGGDGGGVGGGGA